MIKVLITGSNSYIGVNVENWLGKTPELYTVDKVSVRDGRWKEKDFTKYDTVFHVAGIAHVSTDPNMEDNYFEVNRDLTIEIAKKAKKDGVTQFIFMSSIIVYGNSEIDNKIIDATTIPLPTNFYGKSKLEAEKGINLLESENFKVAIFRPPMVYGEGCKGNYKRLSALAKKTPVFPNINNQRSMLHIDNLCEFTRLIIKNKDRGIFFPQNKEYIKTSDMVKTISETHNKYIHLTELFNPILYILVNKVNAINKLFGNLVYDKSLSIYKENYRIRDMKESILLTERRPTNR